MGKELKKHRYESPAGRALRDMLGGWREMRARLEELDRELKRIDTGEEAIESLVYCRKYSSDPTAYAAIHYRDLVRIERAPVAEEIEELRGKINRIRFMLAALSEPERFIAVERYIKGRPWLEVARLYSAVSGDMVSTDSLKALRNGIYRKLRPFMEAV